MSAPKLTEINVCAFVSEETPCFNARLEYNGRVWHVSNDGRGGCNRYVPFLPREVEAELDAWAAANNPRFDAGLGDGSTLAMDFETWTFGKAFDLCEA